MRFLADESLEGPIVRRLRDEGYDVTYIAEAGPARRIRTFSGVQRANRAS